MVEELHPAQVKALSLVAAIMENHADIMVGNPAATLAILDRELSANDQEKMLRCMLKTFLQFDFSGSHLASKCEKQESVRITYRKDFEGVLKRFIKGEFEVQDGEIALYSDIRQGNLALMGGKWTYFDAYSVYRVIGDELAKNEKWSLLAKTLAGQFALFLQYDFYPAGGDMVLFSKKPKERKVFDIWQREVGEATLESPLKQIRIIEFAGENDEEVEALNQIFADYRIILPYEEHAKTHRDSKLISLKFRGELGKTKDAPIMIARNVFDAQALDDYTPFDVYAELLCVMADAMANGGRLYINTTYIGALHMYRDDLLMAAAGFRVHEVENRQKPIMPNLGARLSSLDRSFGNAKGACFTLERDHTIRGPSLMTEDDFKKYQQLAFDKEYGRGIFAKSEDHRPR